MDAGARAQTYLQLLLLSCHLLAQLLQLPLFVVDSIHSLPMSSFSRLPQLHLFLQKNQESSAVVLEQHVSRQSSNRKVECEVG